MSDTPHERDAREGRHRFPVIVLEVAAVIVFVVVMLVLTGIIAEPETLIENIVRMLIGR